jgi:hypothetical protein
MAKANRLYSGHDSYGRAIEVAERTDGVWFWREYRWNGYGMGWSKWKAYGKVPTFPARIRNMCEYADAPEYVEIPEEDRANRIEWGFNVLRIIPGPYRVRLPN